MEWQTIDTAPKDEAKTRVDLWLEPTKHALSMFPNRKGYRRLNCFWAGKDIGWARVPESGLRSLDQAFDEVFETATHWMPLPQPPKP